jgi:hypothetical protein
VIVAGAASDGTNFRIPAYHSAGKLPLPQEIKSMFFRNVRLPRNRTLTVAALMLILAAAATLYLYESAEAFQSAPETRDVKWQEDLNVFASRFPKSQKDFGKLYQKDKFDEEVNAIRKDVPQLSGGEITLRLMRLVASAHVGHTTVNEPLGFHRLPLILYWFSDGLAVTAAAQQYEKAAGARVLRIGAMTPAQLEAAVAPYISFETEAALHQSSPNYMRLAELLHLLKLDNSDGSIDVTFAKPAGEPFTLTITPVFGPLTLETAYDVLHIPPPLYRKQPASFYWYEYLPDSQTLFIQYNKCENDPKQHFDDFVNSMFAVTDAMPVKRVVVDIRFNGGGNSFVLSPLERALKDRPAFSAPGHFYTLIGRATFSSGMDAAIDLRNHLHTILVGEALGEKPNSYGEVREFKLPNSGLVVQYSTNFQRFMKDSDPPSLEPDILAIRSLDDFLAGRDPALDAAIRHPLQ